MMIMTVPVLTVLVVLVVLLLALTGPAVRTSGMLLALLPVLHSPVQSSTHNVLTLLVLPPTLLLLTLHDDLSGCYWDWKFVAQL